MVDIIFPDGTKLSDLMGGSVANPLTANLFCSGYYVYFGTDTNDAYITAGHDANLYIRSQTGADAIINLVSRVETQLGIMPYQTGTQYCGESGLKWLHVYTVNQHTGDVLFSEKGCPVCNQHFLVGEQLVLRVVEIGDETRTIPVHAKHKDGDPFTSLIYKWVKNPNDKTNEPKV